MTTETVAVVVVVVVTGAKVMLSADKRWQKMKEGWKRRETQAIQRSVSATGAATLKRSRSSHCHCLNNETKAANWRWWKVTISCVCVWCDDGKDGDGDVMWSRSRPVAHTVDDVRQLGRRKKERERKNQRISLLCHSQASSSFFC